jgi:hypothetical protein
MVAFLSRPLVADFAISIGGERVDCITIVVADLLPR